MQIISNLNMDEASVRKKNCRENDMNKYIYIYYHQAFISYIRDSRLWHDKVANTIPLVLGDHSVCAYHLVYYVILSTMPTRVKTKSTLMVFKILLICQQLLFQSAVSSNRHTDAGNCDSLEKNKNPTGNAKEECIENDDYYYVF